MHIKRREASVPQQITCACTRTARTCSQHGAPACGGAWLGCRCLRDAIEVNDETNVEAVRNEPAVGTPTGCTSSRAAALFGGEKVVVEDCFRTEKDEFFCAAAGSTEGVSSGRPSGGQPRCSKAVRVKASTSPGKSNMRKKIIQRGPWGAYAPILKRNANSS